MVMPRQALKAVLEQAGLAVVAEASNGHEAVELVRKHRPDVAILDIATGRLNGLEVTRDLQRTCPSTRVILLGVPDDRRDIVGVLQCGASGLVVKTQSIEDLVWAIREVQRGGFYVGPTAGLRAVEVSRAAGIPAAKPLSAREQQVLTLVAAGKSTKQVAAILKIAVKTAGFHRAHLMKKLNIHHTAGLVRYAIRQGWVET
jgi:DNA-binding NarL/FixJ family response regulator